MVANNLKNYNNGDCIPNIRKVCYELYKEDWLRRISADRKIDAIRNYYADLVDPEEIYTFDDYIQEFGYDGELYVCFDEFLENEYRDTDYMRELIDADNVGLIELYMEDWHSRI